MSEEKISPFFTVIKDRLESKIYSALFISWPIINYKLILVLLSPGDYDKKIDFIEKELYCGERFDLDWHLFYLPVISVLLVNLIIPFADLAFTAAASWFEYLRARIVMWVKRIEPIPAAEQAMLFDKWETELAGKDARYESLSAANAKLRAQKDNAVSVVNVFWSQYAAQIFSERCGGGADLADYVCAHQWDVRRDGDLDLQNQIINHPLHGNIVMLKRALVDFVNADGKESRELGEDWFKKESGLTDQLQFYELMCILNMLQVAQPISNQQPRVFRVRDTEVMSGLQFAPFW